MKDLEETNKSLKIGQKLYDHIMDQEWTIESIDGDNVTIVNSVGYRAIENIKESPNFKLTDDIDNSIKNNELDIKNKSISINNIEYVLYIVLYTIIIFMFIIIWIVLFNNIFKNIIIGLPFIDAFLQTTVTWVFPLGMSMTVWKILNRKTKIRINKKNNKTN